jgi:hypothetical protein
VYSKVGEGTLNMMKRFVSGSRPVKADITDATRDSSDATAFDSPKSGNFTSDSETSPDGVASITSEPNIADILCTLEQVYDTSFLKWDDIRKTDEIEHALMRGVTADVVCEEINLTSDESNDNGNDAIKLNDADQILNTLYPDAANDILRCEFGSQTTSDSAFLEYRALGRFTLWLLVLLFLLFISYVQRIHAGTCTLKGAHFDQLLAPVSVNPVNGVLFTSYIIQKYR